MQSVFVEQFSPINSKKKKNKKKINLSSLIVRGKLIFFNIIIKCLERRNYGNAHYVLNPTNINDFGKISRFLVFVD